MVKCPRCQNRPNECYRSRWYKQLIFILTLRTRWRCMRCGATFAGWIWEERPINEPFRRQGNETHPESDHDQVGDALAEQDSMAESTTLQ